MESSTHNKPAYRVVTSRLVIRCWDPHDASLMKEAIDSSLDHLRPWMPWANDEPTDLQTKIERMRSFRGMFDLDQDYVFGIFDLDERRVLGGTGLHTRLGEGALEIGYWIRADVINQGIATESSAALTKVAFEINQVNRVEIHCDPANLRSAAVPRKLGYTHEATLKQRLLLEDGGWRDTMIWTLLAEDYPNSPSSQASIEAFDATGRKIL
jgi:RimJ/RimL family protein N-acetyltransferase